MPPLVFPAPGTLCFGQGCAGAQELDAGALRQTSEQR